LRLGGGFYAAGEGPIGKAGDEFVAGGELSNRADDEARGIEDQGIAAVEDGKRGKRVEAAIEGAEAGSVGMNQAVQRAVEANAASQKVLAGLGQRPAWIVAKNGGGEVVNLASMLAELGAEGRFLAESEVVEALGQTVNELSDAELGVAVGEAREALAGLQKLEAGGAVKTMREVG